MEVPIILAAGAPSNAKAKTRTRIMDLPVTL
jgi:hypothetical protein